MTTETDLRDALRSRAADAPTVDPDRLLASLAARPTPVRVTAVRSRGRQWAIAGVAAGVVALAAVPVALVAHDDAGPRTVDPGGVVAPSASAVVSWTASGAPSPTASVPVASASTSAAVNPNDPAAPVPLDASWVDTATDPSVEVDPAAIVFSSDPIVAFYVRAHEQLSILPGGGTAKDSSDAPWHTAVQVHLAGGGFDPASIGDPTAVTVNGVTRQCGTLPKLLAGPGPAAMPSLLGLVGDAWVVLQIDTLAVPTADQLAAAAARIDVHPG